MNRTMTSQSRAAAEETVRAVLKKRFGSISIEDFTIWRLAKDYKRAVQETFYVDFHFRIYNPNISKRYFGKGEVTVLKTTSRWNPSQECRCLIVGSSSDDVEHLNFCRQPKSDVEPDQMIIWVES